MKIPKTKEIYFNFSTNTNKRIREDCKAKVSKMGIPWINNKNYREYLIELKKHKYAICPEGNAIDTHRFWECIYMGVIPICKRNKVVEYFSKNFEITIVDDWDRI